MLMTWLFHLILHNRHPQKNAMLWSKLFTGIVFRQSVQRTYFIFRIFSDHANQSGRSAHS
ncbi:hypothetical protein CKO_02761 [Citrobacter koseri ATCC BAA-895]|uniref:Uncharacterized protein n=1 Tax=Citrobacter koseri (strain ATCC BAA-895 / CDC 4225-83 / SGSC4696) TaxID=290338 RepID=A8AK55_CITK8|nr:hypothetical protein CKO_02761 [Citrobacter koseri ATCC BAA-895]